MIRVRFHLVPAGHFCSMGKANFKTLHVLAFLVLFLALLASASGLFLHSDDMPYYFINQHGDTVKIYGNGVYKNDSFFKAPIFRGTDCAMLFIAIPLLIASLVRDVRKGTPATGLSLLSLLTCFLYYAASLAFGAQFNDLHLLYIAFFSVSFFAVLLAWQNPALSAIAPARLVAMPYKAVYIFLGFTGFALVVAWMPDIVTAMYRDRSLALIENYTTEITYILDIGIIAPLCFISLYRIVKRSTTGFILLDILLTLCIIIGLMLPFQTLFQAKKPASCCLYRCS